MTIACDFVNDQNPSIFVFLNDKNLLPEYVMKSARVTQDEVDALNIAAFADKANRKYPCHTKEACWQSAAHFAGNAEDDDSVRETIVKMAAHHGIENDVSHVFDVFANEFAKVAAAQTPEPEITKYAMTVDFGGFQDRGIEKFYPINNYSEIMYSAEQANTDFETRRLPLAQMRKAATAIVKAAHEFAVHLDELPVNVKRLGVERAPDPFAAKELIRMRKAANVDMAPYMAILDDLCEQMPKTASIHEAIELGNKSAAELVALDAQNGIRYDWRMSDPYELLFTGATVHEFNKVASQLVRISDISVPVTDFLNLQDATIDMTFSPELAGVIKSAKADVSNGPSLEACAEANYKLASMSPDASKVLLTTLLNTTW